MRALFRDIWTNLACGIHRTFLDEAGAKLGRKMLGRAGGAAIKLDADEDVTLGLGDAHVNERKLAEIFSAAKIEKIELKSETWQWEQTRNICIEYRQDNKRSGIAVTEADVWVHELRRGDQTLCWLMFPIERLKELTRQAYAAGHYHEGGGDGGRFSNILIPLSWVLK
jgi:hypothetical protein